MASSRVPFQKGRLIGRPYQLAEGSIVAMTNAAILVGAGLLAFAPLAQLALLGCSQGSSGDREDPDPSDEELGFRVETFAQGLVVPWSIVFVPDGRVFVAERPGRVRVIESGVLREEPLATIEEVASEDESGLMGMTLHPSFSENHWLYLSYAYRDGGSQFVRVSRYRETGKGLSEPLIIVGGIPAAPFHAGCRIKFGPDGKLYVTTGDATDRAQAQRLDSLAGKTLRLNDDGSVPTDNPFVERDGARPEIWSYGHRNAQGIAWQPETGLQFQTEHGPSGFDGPGGGDEVNIVERGTNFGWPTIHHRQTHPEMREPLLEYTPAVAPAGCTFYEGELFPALRGNFFFGCLRGERLIRVVLEGRTVVRQEPLLVEEFGRIRDVVEGPDGMLYVSTSNRDGRGGPAPSDDRILRLVPVAP